MMRSGDSSVSAVSLKRITRHKPKSKSFWSWCCCCERYKDDTCYLYAFDFDHTIVNENSDAAITEVVPQPIPDDVKCIFDGSNWTEFMDQIFRYIASQGATIQVLADKIRHLELTPGMEEVLHRVAEAVKRKPQSHMVIISDANDFFINTRLLNLDPPVVPSAVLSNHATISGDRKYLKLYPCHDQTDCDLCPKNMCKGKALRKYIVEHGPFTKVFYTGDGGNDVCPAQILSENDVLFVRSGLNLDKIIAKGQYRGCEISIVAKIVYFEDGKQILDNLLF